jgi:hypothetical protein
VSWEQIRRAWAAPCQTPSQRVLLLALADFANDAGLCYPSQRTLAAASLLSDRHVRRVTAELSAAGLVTVTPHGKAHAYQLSLSPVQRTPRPPDTVSAAAMTSAISPDTTSAMTAPHRTFASKIPDNRTPCPDTMSAQPSGEPLREPPDSDAGAHAREGAAPAGAPGPEPLTPERRAQMLAAMRSKLTGPAPRQNGHHTDPARRELIERRRREAASIADQLAAKAAVKPA